MCGIVGVISKYSSMPFYVDSLFTNMLAMDSIRGPDSTGVFGVSSGGHVDHVKGDTDGYIFGRSASYLDFKRRIEKNYRIVIGHNRKATTGSVSAANAHPFQEKHIILVHNGTLRDTKDLTKTEVDSHAIAHALADHDPVKALSMLDGAYALVWYDQNQKTLNLARNSERPLSILQYPSIWVIASEIGLPLWLNARENRSTEKENGIIRVPEKKILQFKLDKLEKMPTEIPYEEYKRWSAPSSTYHQTWPQESGGTRQSATFHESKVIPITKKSENADRLKSGQEILIELDDARTENGAEVLLGAPIFDGCKDENIIVRTVLKKGESFLPYFGTSADPKLWRATICHVRPIQGIPTLYVNNLEPYIVVVDAQGEHNSKEEVAAAMAAGCSRCKIPVPVEDAPLSIVRKKANGWRIVCPKCLSSSIEAAREKNPNIQLRARVTH